MADDAAAQAGSAVANAAALAAHFPLLLVLPGTARFLALTVFPNKGMAPTQS